MQLEFRGKYELEDFYQGIDLLWKTDWCQLTKFYSVSPMPVILVALVLFAGLEVLFGSGFMARAAPGLWGLPGLFSWLLLGFSVVPLPLASGFLAWQRWRVKKAVQAVRRSFQEIESTLIVTEEEFISMKDDGSVAHRFAWTALKELKEDDSCLVLTFKDPFTFFVVPKRFLSAEQVAEFRTMLSRWVKSLDDRFPRSDT